MSPYYLHPDGGWKANCAAALLTVVYVKVLMAVCDTAVSAGYVPKDVSRKIVHIGAASWMLLWPLFDPTCPYGTWRLNVLVPAVFSVQLVCKGAILKDPNDTDVKTMSRTGDPTELLYGPFFFTLCMNCMGLLLFQTEEAVYCMAALGYGDGIAPLVGTRWPVARFRCPGGVKSAGGCLAVFFGTVLGYMVFSRVLGVPESAEWAKVSAVALWTTIVEGLSPGDYDNLAIPAAVYLYGKLNFSATMQHLNFNPIPSSFSPFVMHSHPIKLPRRWTGLDLRLLSTLSRRGLWYCAAPFSEQQLFPSSLASLAIGEQCCRNS